MYKREKTAEEWLLIQTEQRRWQIAVDLLLIQPTAGYQQCARENIQQLLKTKVVSVTSRLLEK